MSIGIGIGGGSSLPPEWGTSTSRSANTSPARTVFEIKNLLEESPSERIARAIKYANLGPAAFEMDGGLAEALARAIEQWKDRMLKGLNALTEDDIEEKVAEFRAFHTREDMSEEELAELDVLVQKFEDMLRLIAEKQHTEMLITAGNDPEEESERNNIARFLRSQMLPDPLQPPRETENTEHSIKHMAGRYESMLSSQQV